MKTGRGAKFGVSTSRLRTSKDVTLCFFNLRSTVLEAFNVCVEVAASDKECPSDLSGLDLATGNVQPCGFFRDVENFGDLVGGEVAGLWVAGIQGDGRQGAVRLADCVGHGEPFVWRLGCRVCRDELCPSALCKGEGGERTGGWGALSQQAPI